MHSILRKLLEHEFRVRPGYPYVAQNGAESPLAPAVAFILGPGFAVVR